MINLNKFLQISSYFSIALETERIEATINCTQHCTRAYIYR